MIAFRAQMPARWLATAALIAAAASCTAVTATVPRKTAPTRYLGLSRADLDFWDRAGQPEKCDHLCR